MMCRQLSLDREAKGIVLPVSHSVHSGGKNTESGGLSGLLKQTYGRRLIVT